MLDDLVRYWRNGRLADFDPSAPTLLTLSYYPLQITAAEWINHVNFMHFTADHNEQSLETALLS